MKIFATVLLSLFAVSAFACPDLSGTYQCQKDDQDPNDTGVVTVTTQNGYYVWTDMDDQANPGTLPTDGKVYQDGNNTYMGSCEGDLFVIKLTGVDEQVGPYNVDMNFSLDASKNLSQKGVAKFNYGGQPQQQPFEATCTRM